MSSDMEGVYMRRWLFLIAMFIFWAYVLKFCYYHLNGVHGD